MIPIKWQCTPLQELARRTRADERNERRAKRPQGVRALPVTVTRVFEPRAKSTPKRVGVARVPRGWSPRQWRLYLREQRREAKAGDAGAAVRSVARAGTGGKNLTGNRLTGDADRPASPAPTTRGQL